MNDSLDPGWRRAILGGLFGLIPFVGPRIVRGSKNALLLGRQLWVTFVVALVAVGIVVLVLRSELDGGGINAQVVAGVVAVVGVLTQVVAPRFIPLIEGRNNEEARQSAARSMLLRIALAESVALLSFMGVLLTGNAAIYLLGFALGMTGMADAAPTASWVDKGQQQLRESGSTVNLLRALTSGGPD